MQTFGNLGMSVKSGIFTSMNTLLKSFYVLCSFLFVLPAHAQYKIEVLDSNAFHLGEGVILHKTSFRGLSVVNDNVIWVSGSRGTIARSVDGGNHFEYMQLKGYEKSDFRDIEAFDDKRAIIMSSGTPAYILKTTDGGNTWKEVYKNTDSTYFLDAMDFWDEKQGMLVGDPVNGHFVLLQTEDGGDTWKEVDTAYSPSAITGEAVFAASGTSLRYIRNKEVAFVTGGMAARWITYNTVVKMARIHPIDIIHGKSSQGIFSLTRSEAPYFVGGDYVCDSCLNTNSVRVSWPKIKGQPIQISMMEEDVRVGYRSCVEALSTTAVIACGTRGVDVSNAGTKWRHLSGEPFHVVRKAKKGKAVFFAGLKGKIGKLLDK